MRNTRTTEILEGNGYDKYIFHPEYRNINSPFELSNMFNSIGRGIDSITSTVNIITHGGTFHGDEISAISLLLIMYPDIQFNVYRATRRTLNELEDLGKKSTTVLAEKISDKFDIAEGIFTFVIDVLGKYDTDMIRTNYVFLDHHQDIDIPASNMLVMDYILKEESTLYGLRPFMERVNNIDRFKSDYNEHPTEFTSIIRSFNSTPDATYNFTDAYYSDSYNSMFGLEEGIRPDHPIHVPFLNALAYGVASVSRAVIQSMTAEVTRQGFLSLPTINKFKVSTSPAVLSGWQTIAEAEGDINGLVVKDNQSSGYVVISHDTTIFKIPSGHGELFLHKSGFMGKYSNFEDAMAAIGVVAASKS